MPGEPGTSLAPPTLPGKGERALSEIVSELWQNAEKLIRQEIALGRSEIETKLDRAKKEIAVIATGGAVLYAGVLTLVAALVLLLATVIALWLSALIIGAVVSGIGFAMARRTPPSPSELVPTRTMASVEQDVRTFTEAAK